MAHPLYTLRLNEGLLRVSEYGTLEQNLNLAASLQTLLQQTQDHRKAVDAIFEKRNPHYTGG